MSAAASGCSRVRFLSVHVASSRQVSVSFILNAEFWYSTCFFHPGIGLYERPLAHIKEISLCATLH